MSNLKPGEYETATGKRAWWKRDDLDGEDRYTHVNEDHASQAYIRKADLRAAAQALIALADELETEWVKWECEGTKFRMRVVAGEASRAEWRDVTGYWLPANPALVAAFEAGQEWGR